jgi:anaerobic selenocysteine-containing dehydrogenase
LLTDSDLSAQGNERRFVAWSEAMSCPILYDPVTGSYEGDQLEPALFGAYPIKTLQGEVVCQPAFELTAGLCLQYPPERVEAISGIPAEHIEAAAQMLWEARPLAHYAWSGVEMQTNATQIARAIAQLSVLTGSFDVPGGNVRFPAAPTVSVADVEGRGLLPALSRFDPLADRSFGNAQRLGNLLLWPARLVKRPGSIATFFFTTFRCFLGHEANQAIV